MGQELRFLILDESPDFVSVLLGELRTAGYLPVSLHVLDIESLSLALDDASWDLVIADYSMPGFMGAGVLDLIRGKGLDVPLILVSANLAKDVALAALRTGVDDYLPKSQLGWIGPAVERTLREVAERRARRRAEEALRAAESRLSDARLGLGGLAMHCDACGTVTSCSAQLLELLGHPRQDVVGRNWFREFLAPDERARVEQAFLRALATALCGEVEEYHVVALDGTRRAIRWQTSVLVDAAGQILGMASVGVELPHQVGPNDTVPPSLRQTLGVDVRSH